MKVAAKARMVPHPRREWWERSWWDMALSLLCFVKNAQLWTSFQVFDVTVECANSAGTFECEQRCHDGTMDALGDARAARLRKFKSLRHSPPDRPGRCRVGSWPIWLAVSISCFNHMSQPQLRLSSECAEVLRNGPVVAVDRRPEIGE